MARKSKGNPTFAPEFKIQGIEAVLNALGEVDKKLGKKILRKGLRAGAKVVENFVKANAPIGDSGLVLASIKVKAQKKSRKSFGLVVTTGDSHPYKGKAYYAAFIEYGTSKMPARPFLRESYEQSKDIALAVIEQKVFQLIDESVKESAAK